MKKLILLPVLAGLLLTGCDCIDCIEKVVPEEKKDTLC